jgi:hypothetical protein
MLTTKQLLILVNYSICKYNKQAHTFNFFVEHMTVVAVIKFIGLSITVYFSATSSFNSPLALSLSAIHYIENKQKKPRELSAQYTTIVLQSMRENGNGGLIEKSARSFTLHLIN